MRVFFFGRANKNQMTVAVTGFFPWKGQLERDYSQFVFTQHTTTLIFSCVKSLSLPLSTNIQEFIRQNQTGVELAAAVLSMTFKGSHMSHRGWLMYQCSPLLRVPGHSMHRLLLSSTGAICVARWLRRQTRCMSSFCFFFAGAESCLSEEGTEMLFESCGRWRPASVVHVS